MWKSYYDLRFKYWFYADRPTILSIWLLLRIMYQAYCHRSITTEVVISPPIKHAIRGELILVLSSTNLVEYLLFSTTSFWCMQLQTHKNTQKLVCIQCLWVYHMYLCHACQILEIITIGLRYCS